MPTNISTYDRVAKIQLNLTDMTYSVISTDVWDYEFTDDETDQDYSDGSSGNGKETTGELMGTSLGGMYLGTANYSGYTINGNPVVDWLEAPNYYVYYNHSDFDPGSSGSLTAGDYVYCFARGTQIATPQGGQAVEALRIGDEVINQAGAAVRVKWLGRQTINRTMARLLGRFPVRIQQGALGHGLPLRDLYVSPDHAICVDGVLVHASALVNQRTITHMEDWPGVVEYFHIETEQHELVRAEGAWAETFIDAVSRQSFDNYAEYVALYPNAAPMQELNLPRVKFRRQLARAISTKLEAVADALQAPAQAQPAAVA